MKILLACTRRPGTTKVGGDLGEAFQALGHHVAYCDFDDRPLALRVVPRPFRSKDYRLRITGAQNLALRRAVQREQPQLVLVVKGFLLDPDTIACIKAAGAVSAGYWIDDPLEHENALRLAPAYDLFFTNDGASVASYRQHGLAQIHHLPSSANSRLFRPLAMPRDLPVAFIGTRTDGRQTFVEQLREFPIHVFGPGWPQLRMGGSIRTYPAAFDAKTNEVYNRARVNLNIHTWVGRGSAVNLRLFEVPAAGAFLLTDWVDEIADHYVENEHIACYRGIDDLKRKLEYFLSRPDECERMAQAARQHFLAHHSYSGRAQRILDVVGASQTTHP
jgi:spore maturation protein CgeB